MNVNGEDIWLNAINLPWITWTDFETPWGHNNYDSGEFEAAFQKYAQNGINAVRVWVHSAGQGGPLLDETGNVIGVVDELWDNFDDMMRLANEYEILVMPSLFSFEILNPATVPSVYPNQNVDNFWAFVSDPDKTQTYIDNVLISLVSRYEDDPMLLAWEICNEPEWMFEDFGYDQGPVIRWHAQIAAAIHKISSKPVKIGAASLKWNWDNPHGVETNIWSDESLQSHWDDPDAYFDWYQIHFYEWMVPYFVPFYNGPDFWGINDRPVIIGEFPGHFVDHNGFCMDVTQMYEAAYQLGYAGAFGWSDYADDGHGTFENISVATNYMKATYPDDIYTPNVSTDDGWKWYEGFFTSGMDDNVHTLTVFNGELYAGGQFTTAGGISANKIARWDGEEWHPLGQGMNGTVHTLMVFNGELYAGGSFTTAGGISANRIARWDGEEWHSLGQGMDNVVNTLTVYNGGLYAGGQFTTAGGIYVNRIARWDGEQWSPLGQGIGYYASDCVHSMTVFNGKLYAGGRFAIAGGVDANFIACWDGEQWQALEEEMNSAISVLTVFNGDLYAGGWFTTVGGISTNRIARWDGEQWSPLGTGMNSLVNSLAEFNGGLYAGGWFTTAGGMPANRIAHWDGEEWHPLGEGMSSTVETLTVYNGGLYAGGSFTTAGGVSANRMAFWNGEEWSTNDMFINMGMDDIIRTFTVMDGRLYAGGDFDTAGGTLARGIAKHDGNEWYSLGNGANNKVYSLGVLDEYLYAGGWFTSPGHKIARWDGSYWENFSPVSNSVHAFAVMGDHLFAGGLFTIVSGGPGGISANRIARWDGEEWHPLGEGMDDRVDALAVFNGGLYAGGKFTTAGGVPANRIARWDGEEWHPLGTGMDGFHVYALAVHDGGLYAGGDFTTAGGIPANRIARWDGEEWHPLGEGMNAPVNALVVFNGQLYAGGAFTSAGGKPINRIARWCSAEEEWYPLHIGVNDTVFALTVHNGELYAGGRFTTAGGKSSSCIAKWYREGHYYVNLYSVPSEGIELFGSGSYQEGELVTIQAITYDETYTFMEWTGSPEDIALLDDQYSSSASFILPDRHVSFTAVFSEGPAQKYSVTLFYEPDHIDVGLTGAGEYEEGETVIISTEYNTPKGFIFSEWTGDHTGLLNDPSSPIASFTMPDFDIIFTAVYQEYFEVTLLSDPNDIGVILEGSGTYQAGEEVFISASLGREYQFIEWTGTPEDIDLLSDANSSSATFTMPARNVTLTAVFESEYIEAVPVIISLENPLVKGIWEWTYDPDRSNYLDFNMNVFKSSWSWKRLITDLTAKKLLAGDISGDGLPEVIIHFNDNTLGYYSFSTGTWSVIIDNCYDFTVASTAPNVPKKIIFSIEQGVYVHDYKKGNTRIYTVPAEILYSADIYRNGIDELLIGFVQLSNLYVYCFDTESHSVIARIKPSQMLAGDLTGDGFNELVCAFEGFGIYLFRNISGRAGHVFDELPLFDLINDIPEGHKWVSGKKGWQVQRLTFANPMPGHKMAIGNIACGNANELILSMIGRTFYYSYFSEGWTTLVFAPMKTIASDRFTGGVKDDLIACMSLNNSVYLWCSAQNIWYVLVNAGNSNAMVPVR